MRIALKQLVGIVVLWILMYPMHAYALGKTIVGTPPNNFANEERILEYSTNTFFQDVESKFHLYFPEYTESVDETGLTGEYRINYAFIRNDDYYLDCIRWKVPDTYDDNYHAMAVPDVCYFVHSIEVLSDSPVLTCEIIEADCIDWHYRIAPVNPPEPDCISSNTDVRPNCVGVEEHFDIKPYSGFYPEKIISAHSSGLHPEQYYVEIYPVQYDYEHEIVRAYTHIKFKILCENMAAAATIDADSQQHEYYNLQGIRVNPDNLAPGCYIVRTAGKSTKVFIGK